MRKGILGRKIGMTQVFAKNGKLTPVTVIAVEPNYVSQIKTVETDGYNAIQLAAFDKREKLSNKPEQGHLKKANVSPKRFLKEIRNVDVSAYTLGGEVKADIFTVGEMVDVSGVSKGKGFQGVIKRYGQSRGPMGHGSQYHRGVGSLGTLLPMHVLKGKKLPGHMGHKLVTVQNLEVVEIDLENNVILVKGNVPGPKKSLVIIKSAIKNEGKVNAQDELITYVEEVVEETPVEETATEETTEVAEEVKAEEPVEEAASAEETAETTEEATEAPANEESSESAN
ncbi:MAG: 50S ribosomal protein L3 [Bacilli bacterium]|nr:50S ribosomal protein L3 [Bacilli bacterium]